MSQTVRRKKAKLAAETRHHPEADHADLKRDLRAEVLADHIRRTVDQAPPLTPEQRDRLATLLRPSPDSGEAA